VQDYYEEFERAHDERYQQQYGPWRRVIGEVMRKYLECGDLHRGFARLACGRRRYQTILAYSCKCRFFCSSCHQKRVLLFAEWLDTHILEQVSHTQYVFTIPKLLRPIFEYHRRELGLLCKSAWQALREMFQEVASDLSALPGVVITVQSYGDRINLHPHIHAVASRGVWSSDGSFEPIPALDALRLMLLFRHHMLQNLLACGRIGQATLDILERFHHPGFSACEGEGVAAGNSAANVSHRILSMHRFLSPGSTTTATPAS
jgi:hypothetical protein